MTIRDRVIGQIRRAWRTLPQGRRRGLALATFGSVLGLSVLFMTGVSWAVLSVSLMLTAVALQIAGVHLSTD